jgi:hypothetical protein
LSHIFNECRLLFTSLSDMLSLGLPALHVAPFFLYSNVYQVGETEAIDEQEQYFEVPHWMHLSFTSYDSDKTVFSNDVISDPKENTTSSNEVLSGIEIKANGFVMPRVADVRIRHEPTSPLLRPSSLAHGGTHASVNAEQTVSFSTQRQLIEGRDFRDILEACRPKHGGVMPTPLRALLEVHSLNTANRSDRVFRLCEANEAVDMIREEWGSTEFSMLSHKRHNTTLDPISPGTINNLRERSVSMDVFLSSSAGSQSTGRLLGSDYQNLGNSTGLQLPAFLDYHLIEEEHNGINTSRSDDYSSDDEFVSTSFEDRFRRMMEAHDRAVPSFSPPKTDNNSDMRSGDVTNASRDSLHRPGGMGQSSDITHPNSRYGSSQQLQATGGLGAALVQHKQYSGKRGISFVEGVNTDSTPRIINGRGSLVSAFRRINELEMRGVSPLLLPPVISQQQLDIPDILGYEARPILDQSGRSTTMIAPRNSRRVVTNLQSSRVLDNLRNQELNVSSHRSETTITSELDNSRQGATSNKTTPRKLRSKMRKKVFNPFRQQDEEEVLEKKSHNRRRWSQ